MLNKISIKTKLLLYGISIQTIVFIIFSYTLYKSLEISTIDKIQSTLNIIIFDIRDDIIEHSSDLINVPLNEEDEYKYKPLYIRIMEIKQNSLLTIKSTNYAKDINIDFLKIKNMEKNKTYFISKDDYLISQMKITLNNKEILIEVATSSYTLEETLENLLYLLGLITPIILILSTLGANFILLKSFKPIEKILGELKTIQAQDLSKTIEGRGSNDEIDQLTDEINSLIKRLNISFEKISQFSSDVSHELKTPLTIIRGEIEIGLRKDRSNEEYKEILNSCLDEILIIKQTIDDLLFLAKSEQNSKPLQKDEIYLDEITYEAMKELESFAKLKNITCKCEIIDASHIEGYEKPLKIALKNVIKNAISFSNQNSQVLIKNYIKDDKYIISIKDEGIGIPKDEQEKIFEKFYRTDKSRNKDLGGTGLGMSICKKIIQMHDAKIIINSKENIGTTVFLVFKIK
ncbi:sensor histidine kinase [Poseidonibacter sp.]|uniref:sensor histidine kinase n=1 Tax=Poseidonibacter sp. TaxID=2321188 RepID=UPI003C77EF22